MNEFDEDMKEAKKAHEVWFHFSKYMSTWYFYMEDNWKIDERDDIIRDGTQSKTFASYKMVGYEAMKRVEEYCVSYPDHVRRTYVDDAGHSTSMIALVPHPKMGITCIFIPQNAIDEKNQFFLYPKDAVHVLETIKEMLVENELGE